MKKVLIFQPVVPQYRLGFFRFLNKRLGGNLEVCATQAKQAGFEISGANSCGFCLRNITTLSLSFFGKKLFIQPYLLRALVRRDVDVIITMNQMSRPEIWLALLLKHCFYKKVILWGHGFVPRDGSKTNWFRKKMVAMSDAAVFYSYSGKDKAESVGLCEDKLFVAPNALNTVRIDHEKSLVDKDSLQIFSREKGLYGKFVVLCVGRMLKYKKYEVLIRAMPGILEEIPEVLVLFIGDGPYFQELKCLVHELGLDASVRFEGAVFDEAVLARYFMLSKVGVMPAHAGLFIQHAFQYGLPVVVGDDMKNHPPEIELIEAGKNGLFFKDGDATDAAAKIVGLLGDESLRTLFSENAVTVIKDKNNISNMCQGFMDAIRFSRQESV